ncbi:reverse transcriptase [Tanacetum coccineum]
MNTSLVDTIADYEIVCEVKQLGAYKAPGKDGFPGLFFKKYWTIVGNSVCSAVKQFFVTGFMPSSFNKTLVVLILKIPALEQNKNELFSFILDKVLHKMQGWKQKLLSQAGREILIKSVIKPIPSYAMQCYLLPKGYLDKLLTYIRRFSGMEMRMGPFTNTSLVFDFIVDGEWDYCKLQQHLFPREVDFVSQIPISNTGAQDKLVWHYDDKGNYFVRSGYRQALLLKEKDPNHASSSSSPTGSTRTNFQSTFSTVAWSIWKAHNRFIFERLVLYHAQVIMEAQVNDSDFVRAHSFNPATDLSNMSGALQESSPKWIPPTSNTVKLNCDASFKTPDAASGIVARNSVGSLITCFGKKWRCDSALAAELQAIRIACVFALNKGWFNAIIESDSQTTIMLATTENVPP